MKQGGKVRRMLKWDGTAACVLLVGMLVLSSSCLVTWRSNSDAYYVALCDGSLCGYLCRGQQLSRLQLSTRPYGWHVSWTGATAWRQRLRNLECLPHVYVERNVAWVLADQGCYLPILMERLPYVRTAVIVPIWTPLLVTALPTAFLWWRDRRIPPGHCQKCGYNLTGNVSGRCPECATPTSGNP